MKRIFAVLAAMAALLHSPHAQREALAQAPAVSPSAPPAASSAASPTKGAEPASPAAAATATDKRGVSIYICGHSFHEFIADPLAALAREAGFRQHSTAGKFFVGGSRPLQIWEIPDSRNPTRAALKEGKIDILTLSPHVQMPDRGIDHYANYALQFNPNVRVMVQISWPTHLARPDTNWALISVFFDAYMKTANAQIADLNRKHGKAYVSLVPVAVAVFKLREEIKAGRVPGIRDFAQLFTDDLGHAGGALRNLVTFCWFAAIYKQSPVGLKALDGPAASADTNRALQKIAWDVISAVTPPAVTPAPPAAFTPGASGTAQDGLARSSGLLR